MMISHVIAVAFGAILGAMIRWRLSVWCNGSLNVLPMGTLIVNLIGCFLIGALLVFRLPEFWKLLLITGFLGSLTTFSTFSAELVAHIQQQKWGSVLAILGLHLGGGVMMVVLGASLVTWWMKQTAA